MALDFRQELYNRIGELGLLDPADIKVNEFGVTFALQNISGYTQFKAVGQIELEDRGEEKPVEYLSVSLLLAKDIDEKNAGKMIPKLYEVNMNYRTGMFFLDGGGNLCFNSSFPVLRDDVEGAVKLFLAEFIDLSDFINGVYPYLLRVVAHPEDCNFREYIEAMVGEGE